MTSSLKLFASCWKLIEKIAHAGRRVSAINYSTTACSCGANLAVEQIWLPKKQIGCKKNFVLFKLNRSCYRNYLSLLRIPINSCDVHVLHLSLLPPIRAAEILECVRKYMGGISTNLQGLSSYQPAHFTMFLF